MKPSLQKRMIIAVMVGMTVVLTLFNGVLYFMIHNSLLRQIEEGLSTTAELLAASVEIGPEGLDLEMALEQLPDFSDPHQPLFFQITDTEGRIVALSPNLGSQGIDLPPVSPRDPVFVDCLVANHPAHALAVRFQPRVENADEESDIISPVSAEFYLLMVARESGTFLGQLNRLRWLMTLVSVIVVVLSVGMAWLVARQGLRPLYTMASQISAISADDLSTRVQSRSIPEELAPVTDRLNELLDRLQEAFARERRFTADAAHELRTPLAGLRSVLEVSLSRHREPSEYRAALEECTAIATGMQSMVENLLTLSRLEAHSVVLQSQTFNLASLVDRCWSVFAQDADRRNVTFTSRIEPSRSLESDPDYLAMILNNLFSNAVAYVNSNGRIMITAAQDGNHFRLTITNTGCTLEPKQVKHVFDPFWRADVARAATGLHCGLGLALVRRIVEALGGSVSAEVKDDIFTVQITGLRGDT